MAEISNNIAMTERDSKLLLQQYGVPIVQEAVAADEDEAVRIAEGMGFPVVLKGMGKTLLHKTERGLVHLNLADAGEVRQAASMILREAVNELEGILVQSQVKGKREFVAGLLRDPQFGPVVMFGIGGIYTEALADVTFRVAPLTDQDAEEMLEEIKAQTLLRPFRGESAVNRKELVMTVLGLSRVAEECPEIAEIDINPLIAAPDGHVCAVDALIVRDERSNGHNPPSPLDPSVLYRFFYPRSVAMVGASNQIHKWGSRILRNLIGAGYNGELYLVNPNGGTIAGRQVYRSVTEIPDTVDLGIVTIPAPGVLDLLPQFKAKGIGQMLLITSGFGETGENGKVLETKLISEAKDAGIVILGPNTMGICNPHHHLSACGGPVNLMPGGTAVVAQSGNLGAQLLNFAEEQNIGIRGFCGSGNEAMVCVEDFIDAFETDDVTKTIVLYVEGVKNGRRFLESARRVGKKKPIVLLKGGQSKVGNRAAASHTGALTSDTRVFNAVCRQAGIIKVDRSMDLLDLAAAFSLLPLPKGKRVAIVTLGGGWGVITADMCAHAGLEVPELSEEILDRIDKVLPPYWSRSNPADIVGELDRTIPLRIMEEFLKWDGCDGIITLGIVGQLRFVKRVAEMFIQTEPGCPRDAIMARLQKNVDDDAEFINFSTRMMETYQKPILTVGLFAEQNGRSDENEKGRYRGITFPTPERAVNAFARMFEYQRFLSH